MNEVDDLALLEQNLQALWVQEAEAEAALEKARDARKRQEGAVWWEKRRRAREAQAAEQRAAPVIAPLPEIVSAEENGNHAPVH